MPVYFPRQGSKWIESLNKNSIGNSELRDRQKTKIYFWDFPYPQKGKHLQGIGIILLEGLALV